MPCWEQERENKTVAAGLKSQMYNWRLFVEVRRCQKMDMRTWGRVGVGWGGILGDWSDHCAGSANARRCIIIVNDRHCNARYSAPRLPPPWDWLHQISRPPNVAIIPSLNRETLYHTKSRNYSCTFKGNWSWTATLFTHFCLRGLWDFCAKGYW